MIYSEEYFEYLFTLPLYSIYQSMFNVYINRDLSEVLGIFHVYDKNVTK